MPDLKPAAIVAPLLVSLAATTLAGPSAPVAWRAETVRRAQDGAAPAASAQAQDSQAQDAATTTPAEDADLDTVGPDEDNSFLAGWDGSVELGLNGSSGNTDNLSFRAGIKGERLKDDIETRLSFSYQYAQEDGNSTENRYVFDARNDWLFPDSRWRWFALGRFEGDKFQDWDQRLSFFTGPGYEFINTDKTKLVGRLGLGGTQEFGGSDNFMPEALIGADFAHQISERQKITALAELYPDLEDTGEYRALARAAWEILVDPETNLTLKVGIEDRYDSQPGDGFEHNDIDYFVSLVWSF